MKKVNARTVFVALLIVASFCSYIYLNTVEVEAPSPAASTEIEIEELDEVDGTPKEVVLPDVQLLQKIIESGKRLLPTSSL